MVRGKSTVARSIILGISVLAAGCATIDGKPLYSLRIPPSHGDGNFRDISWRFPWPGCPVGYPIRGYVVKFPAFDLDEEYHAEFVVTDLHDISHDVGVYLVVDDPQPSETAELEIEVYDGKGQQLAHAKKILSGFGDRPSHIEPGDGAESGGELFLVRAQESESYTLRVKYRPDPALRARHGFVYLTCGGSA